MQKELLFECVLVVVLNIAGLDIFNYYITIKSTNNIIIFLNLATKLQNAAPILMLHSNTIV